MSDLETLVPHAIELVVGGEPLAIQPLKVGQLPGFVRAISPVLQPLMGGSGMNSTGSGIDWLTLLGTHGDDLLAAIAIAVGKPRAWVDGLAADEAILVASKIPGAWHGCVEVRPIAEDEQTLKALGLDGTK